MTPLVVYFHGYNSSAKTDKVELIRKAGFDTFAWNIAIDPAESLPVLQDHIDDMLAQYMHQDVELVFVGTSLGAWYATKLARDYGARTILVNPAFAPSRLLPNVGVPKEIADLYTDIVFESKDIVVVAEDDELIDFSDCDFGDAGVIYSATGGHRFNGPEFNLVLNLIAA